MRRRRVQGDCGHTDYIEQIHVRSAGLRVLWAILRYVSLKFVAEKRARKWNSYEPGSDYRIMYSGHKNARSTDEDVPIQLADGHILILDSPLSDPFLRV